jgi:DNA-binding NarL/FixJ family response regulator
VDHLPTDLSVTDLSVQDRLLVHHLVTGKTHQYIAKSLRISERTVRRRLDDLCRRCGVASLLALGVLLGQAGVVTLDIMQQITEV